MDLGEYAAATASDVACEDNAVDETGLGDIGSLCLPESLLRAAGCILKRLRLVDEGHGIGGTGMMWVPPLTGIV